MSRGGTAPALVVLALSEDGGRAAVPVLVALCKGAFKLLVPETRTHRIQFDPPEPNARPGLVANAWKSERPAERRKRIDLARAIARHLLAPEPPGVVVLHFDGDRVWSARETSENLEKFARLLLPDVRRALRQLAPQLEEEALDGHLDALLPMVPFYSVEAWLYQNLDELERIGREDPEIARVAPLAQWRAEPGLLEEIPQIKAAFAPLRDQHNERLATRAWPAAEVYGRGRSFTAFVDGGLHCARLLAALQATCADGPHPP